MKKSAYFYIIGVSFLLAIATSALADQVEQDMFAAVSVNPVFTMSLDNASIDFGYAEPGKSVELKETTYYNMVKCNSNKGKTWRLNIVLLGEVAGPTPTIPVDSFKWKVHRVTGDGAPVEGWQPLSSAPQAAYTSGGRDNTGEEVVVQFKYRLDLPNKASGGYYRTKMQYTMTDVP